MPTLLAVCVYVVSLATFGGGGAMFWLAKTDYTAEAPLRAMFCLIGVLFGCLAVGLACLAFSLATGAHVPSWASGS